MRTISVWSSNFFDQIKKLDRLLHNFKIVSIDAEFPGFLVNTPRKSPENITYQNLKFNVDNTNPIQIGFTLLDKYGEVAGCWEFNLSFDAENDVSTTDSLDFLKEHGMDFCKLKRDGIDIDDFSQVLSDILAKHRDLKWVTFHGLYDIAYMLKLVTKKALPNSVIGFIMLAGHVFGNSVLDLKYVARFCEGLYEGELGLQKLAKIVRVRRIGGAHQAGSDSLLTAMVFCKLKILYGIEEFRHEGFLYSIDARIRKPVRPQQMLAPYQHFCQTKVIRTLVPAPSRFHVRNPYVVQPILRHIYVV